MYAVQLAMAYREPPPPVSGPEIPDLDIDLPARGRPSAATSARSSGDQGPAYGTAGILDDDLLDSTLGTASLDIELTAPARAAASQGAATPPWPTGVTPEPGSVAISQAQIEPLCAWGQRPTNWWQSVIYAYFVCQGRRQLAAQLRVSESDLVQAEAQRDETLAALAASAKDTLASQGALKALLEAVETAAAESGQLAQQKQTVEANLESEVRGLDEALGEQQAKLSVIERQHQQCQRDDEDAQLNLKRELARLQRLAIERRNIEQAGAQDPEAAAKLEALSQQEAGLVPQIDAAKATAAARRTALDGIDSEAAQVQAHMRELQRRKGQLLRSQAAQLQKATSAADFAVARKRSALADLGRAILAAKGRIAVEPAALKELTKHDASVNALWSRQQVYLQALDSYDRDAVRRGTTIVIAFLAVLLLGIAWRAMT